MSKIISNKQIFMEEIIEQCPICYSADRIHAAAVHDKRFGYPGEFNFFECQKCTALYLGHRVKQEHIKDMYSTYYQTSKVELSTIKQSVLQRMKLLLRILFPDTIQASSIKKYNSVLEIGPGMRPIQDRINWKGKKYFAIENDERALAILKNRFGESNSSHDISKLIFELDSERPKCCVADQVLEHIYCPQKFLVDIKSKIHKDASIFIATPNGESIFRYQYKNLWIGWHVPYHAILYTRKSIEVLADQCGLYVKNITTNTPASWVRLQKKTVNEPFKISTLLTNRMKELIPNSLHPIGDNLFFELRPKLTHQML